MAVNPNIASIIAAGYDKIGTMSLQIVHNFDDGYGLSQAQQELWLRLLKTTKLVRILSKFVEFDSDGNYVQVHRLSDTTVNDLLKYLQKVGDLDNLPTAPKIFFNGVPVIRFGSGGGGGGSALANGQIWVGDSTNTAQARTPGGVVTMSNTGIFSLAAGVISDVHISGVAAIAHTKMAALTPSRVMVTDVSGFASASGISTTVLGHISDLTSPVQAQINGKQATITGAATTIVALDLTADRALISSVAGKVAVHANTTAAEIGHVNGVTSPIQTQLNAKQATITGAASTVVSSNLAVNRAVVSGSGGKIEVHPSTTLTEIGFVNGVTSSIQTQLNARLSVTLGALAEGDIIWYNGSAWVNLPRGTNGQALYSTATSIQWNTPTINGIPIGGSLNQALAKLSGTDFDADWVDLTLVFITDVTATAADVNVLQGVDGIVSTSEILTLDGVTSPIQTQLDGKQSSALAQNAIWVGNASSIAAQLTSGTNGYVLTSVGGAPQWQPVPTGTPPGSTTQLIFNDAGAFGADAELTYNKTTNTLTIGTASTNGVLEVFKSNGLSSKYDANGITNLYNAAVGSSSYVINGAPGTASLLSGQTVIIAGGPGSGAGNGGSIQLVPGSTVSGSVGRVIVATTTSISADRFFHVEQDTATTSAVTYVQRLTSTSSGTPANGIGVGIEFEVETASANNEVGASIEAVATDVSSGAEIFDFVFKTMSGGSAATERFRYISSITRFSVTGDLVASNGITSGVGLTAQNGGLSVTVNNAVNNAITYVADFIHNTTGSPANGIGTGIRFQTETTTGTQVGSTIESVATDAVSSSDDFDLVFRTMAAGASASEGLRITSDKRIFGTALHNNAGSVTGTTNQYVASGTYTPTLTNVANLAASTPYQCQWIRVGNVVTVSGKVDIDPTAPTTSTQLGISLPIASNFGAAEDCAGTAFASAIAAQGAAILADTTNDRAQLQYLSGDITNQPMYFTFTYEII